MAVPGVTEPQPHSSISYTNVIESFAESFGEINANEGDNPELRLHFLLLPFESGQIGRCPGSRTIIFAVRLQVISMWVDVCLNGIEWELALH